MPTDEGADYTIDHSVSVCLMNASGKPQSIIAYDKTNPNTLTKL